MEEEFLFKFFGIEWFGQVGFLFFLFFKVLIIRRILFFRGFFRCQVLFLAFLTFFLLQFYGGGVQRVGGICLSYIVRKWRSWDFNLGSRFEVVFEWFCQAAGGESEGRLWNVLVQLLCSLGVQRLFVRRSGRGVVQSRVWRAGQMRMQGGIFLEVKRGCRESVFFQGVRGCCFRLGIGVDSFVIAFFCRIGLQGYWYNYIDVLRSFILK